MNAIEPMNGWQATGVTTSDDLAVTALRAIDVEYELPPEATPIELTGDAFRVEAPYTAVEERAKAAGLEAMTLQADSSGLRAVVSFDVPEAGLYSMSAFVAPGGGQRFLVDGCRKAVVCPSESPAGWRPIMSQTLAAGRHTLVLSLANGASFERLRLEKKKSGASDYVATMRRLGFDPGPQGPVPRGRALDAMRFVREQRRTLMSSLCGDRVLIDESLKGLTTVAGAGAAVVPGQPPGEPLGPGEVPVPPPMLPPQPPSSPTTPGGGL